MGNVICSWGPSAQVKVRDVLLLTERRGEWTLGSSDSPSHTQTFPRTKTWQSALDPTGPYLLNDWFLLHHLSDSYSSYKSQLK